MTKDDYELFKAQWVIKFLPIDQELAKLQLKKLDSKTNYDEYEIAVQKEMALLEKKKKLIEEQTKELINLK